MGIGTKRQQSIDIINRMVSDNPSVTADEIVAEHVKIMYPDKPAAALACYRLTLAEQPGLVPGAPALVSTRGRKPKEETSQAEAEEVAAEPDKSDETDLSAELEKALAEEATPPPVVA